MWKNGKEGRLRGDESWKEQTGDGRWEVGGGGSGRKKRSRGKGGCDRRGKGSGGTGKKRREGSGRNVVGKTEWEETK